MAHLQMGFSCAEFSLLLLRRGLALPQPTHGGYRQASHIHPPLVCGLSGFALQPLDEHVGYSHSRHAQLDLFLSARLAALKASRGFASLQILQRTVALSGVQALHIHPPLVCGLSGFALQPLAEHVGYSHSRHAQTDFCWWPNAGLKATRGMYLLQILHRTASFEACSVSTSEASHWLHVLL